jgi:hypothetical protein
VLGGESLEGICSAGGREDEVVGVGEGAVVARPIPPDAPVSRMKRATGGGAGLAGTGVAWVVMGSTLRDGEGQPGDLSWFIELHVVAGPFQQEQLRGR